MVDRITLEQQEEKVHCADCHDYGQGCVDRPYLISFTRKTKKVNSNGEFGDGRAGHVKKLTYENVLFGVNVVRYTLAT
jgi:hypothetical protein